MRLFYAGDIPAEQKQRLGEIQEKLRSTRADVKWVEIANLHITLRFLGDVKGGRLSELKKIGEEVGRVYGPFDLSLKDLGFFPSKGVPRVVWVGIDEGKKQVSMLAQAVDARLIKAGFKPEEHDFKAHVTLGRVKGPRGTQELLAMIPSLEATLSPWHVEQFVLKESQLSKSGPAYKDVAVFQLGAKPLPRDFSPRRSSLRYAR